MWKDWSFEESGQYSTLAPRSNAPQDKPKNQYSYQASLKTLKAR